MKRCVNLKSVPDAIESPKPDASGRVQFDDNGKLITVTEGFSWADKLRDLVRSGLPEGQGNLSAADIIGLVEVWNAVKDAKDGEMLVMEDDVHKALMKHIERLAWTSFHPVMGEMLHDLKEAPEWKLPAGKKA